MLKERSTEFAADYPGLADRLGGLIEENLDPAIAGLLEGTAFLAARVQTKMDEEYRTFTRELLDQIFPDALRPTPSTMLVQAKPSFEQSELEKGLRYEEGGYLDARFADAEKRVSCRFRLAGALTLWPLAIEGLRYHASTSTLGALGQDIAAGTKAGLAISITRVAPSGEPGGGPLSGVSVDDLPFYLIGPMAEAVPLYEQIHAGRTRASLRFLDRNGDAVFIRLPPNAIQQVGFDEQGPLLPHAGALFSGFATLRDAFVFPRKYMGFRLTGLAAALRGVRASRMDLVLEFDTSNPVLTARLEASHIGLHCVPAVNLFEDTSSQVRLDQKRTEFVVTPDSTPMTHYEIYAITDVHAHYAGNQTKEPVLPLYGVPQSGADPRQSLYFTSRQKPRRLTAKERRFGAARYRYRGTETFISLFEPADAEPAQRLQIKMLCSNRHLPEYLPIAQAKDEFHLSQNQMVTLTCVGGPTPPRDSLLEIDHRSGHRAAEGDSHWRLISFLSLNFHGLLNDRGGQGAAPLRELLSLFANISDTITQTQIDGLKSVESRPVVRTIQRDGGYHPARGLEVTVTFDEDEFEGSGVILMGAILDRFIAEYAAVNSFTQCVVASLQRGTIKTWPPRSGGGPLL